jgi:hypothetical protein
MSKNKSKNNIKQKIADDIQNNIKKIEITKNLADIHFEEKPEPITEIDPTLNFNKQPWEEHEFYSQLKQEQLKHLLQNPNVKQEDIEFLQSQIADQDDFIYIEKEIYKLHSIKDLKKAEYAKRKKAYFDSKGLTTDISEEKIKKMLKLK